MNDWSEETTIIFLEAYQKEPCIWNPKHLQHKNRTKVNDAWTRLSEMMNKSVKELKNKKEVLMATFRRHLNKKKDSIRSGAGADDLYNPIWFAYELMESFLVPVYTSTENISTERRSSSQEELKTKDILVEEEEENNLTNLSTSLNTPRPVASRRRPTTDLAERQMSSAFGQLTNILTNRHNERPPPPKEDDDCDLFAKLIAKKLREYPPDERKLVMYDIDTIFINRLKERLLRQTPSTHYAEPYPPYYEQLPNSSPISTSQTPNPTRPSTSQTSYLEPLRPTTPNPTRPSTIPNRTSTSQTSYSLPLPNTSPIKNRQSTSYSEYLHPSTSQTPFTTTSQNVKTYYITQPDPSNLRTPTIHIMANEVLVPPRQSIINEAFLKAYDDFDNNS